MRTSSSISAIRSRCSISAVSWPQVRRPKSVFIRRWSVPISDPEMLLEIRGMAAGYGKIAVLHSVDIQIGAGEVVSLLGPNGAGKTTLLRAMTGLLPLTGG